MDRHWMINVRKGLQATQTQILIETMKQPNRNEIKDITDNHIGSILDACKSIVENRQWAETLN